jgi:GDP-D-mannose dehydratase
MQQQLTFIIGINGQDGSYLAELRRNHGCGIRTVLHI